MSLSAFLIGLGLLLSVVATFVYISSMVRGNAQPHRTTRFVVSFANIVAFVSLLADGGDVTVWLLGATLIEGLFIFLFSLKYGVGGTSKLDIWSLLIAITGIVIWQITDQPVLALIASMLSDFTGYVPAFIKTWKFPKSEEPKYFWLSAAVVTLIMIANGQIDRELIYPAYILVATFFMLFIIYRNQIKSIINRTT